VRYRDHPALITVPALEQTCHAGVHCVERLAAVASEGRVHAPGDQSFLVQLGQLTSVQAPRSL
jgi:hypothetical protein